MFPRLSTRLFLSSCLCVLGACSPGSGGSTSEAPAATGTAPVPGAERAVHDRAESAGAQTPSSAAEGPMAPQPQEASPSRSAPPPIITRDPTHSRSSILFPKRKIDFGTLYQQDVRKAEFEFTLDGPDDVVITELLPSCGCTGARLVVEGKPWEIGKPIPAGSKGAVEATFESQNFKADKSSTIKVRGNAQNLPSQLLLKAYIKPLFEVLPRMARFDDLLERKLRRNPNPTRILKVTGSRPFEIVRWEGLPDWATVEDFQQEPAPDGEGEVHSLRVGLKPDIAVGRQSAVVRGITKNGKEVAFQIFAGIYGRARYFPERIPPFQIQQQGSQVTRKMIIQATADWLGIPEPEVRYEGDPAFDLVFDELKPQQRYSVEILLKDDAALGRHTGKVLVTWPPDSGIEAKEFPVSVLIRRRP